jgi:hypothetical protein
MISNRDEWHLNRPAHKFAILSLSSVLHPVARNDGALALAGTRNIEAHANELIVEVPHYSATGAIVNGPPAAIVDL